MMTSREYIESGILEQYVLGTANAAECAEVEQMAATYPEIRQEIAVIELAFEKHAMENAVAPSPIIKVFVMAGIDYMTRKANGEPFTNPPLLTPQSTINDYTEWLQNSDRLLKAEDTIVAKIIGYSEKVTTAIVWLSEGTPAEEHTNEYESFLIVEGTCDITIGSNVHSLSAGDYLSIPLYENHFVKVTSAMPCKIILQRVAA